MFTQHAKHWAVLYPQLWYYDACYLLKGPWGLLVLKG